MRKGLKMVAFIIDVIFMPIRALIGLEVVVSAAIFNDVSVKDALREYGAQIKNYPNLLKEGYEVIFKGKELGL